MKFVDYDNDGKKDLFIRFNDGGYCTYQNSRIYWNTGNDNLPYDESSYYEFNQPGQCSYLSPIDMNSDNYLDLILEVALGSGDGIVYINNHDRTFSQSSSNYSSGRDVSIKILDINNDGKEDILGFDTGFNGDQINVNIQDNTSNFNSQLGYYNSGEKPNPGLTLDNQHFIFNCSNDGSSYRNLIKGTWNGSGFGFTKFPNLLPIGIAYLVNSIDYNNDGKMDFLVASDTATNLRNYDMYYGENGFSFSISNKKRVFTGVNYYIKECFFDQNEFRYTGYDTDSLYVFREIPCIPFTPTIMTSNQSPCEGQTVTLTGSGGILFNWNSTNYSTNPTLMVSQPGGNYKLKVKDANGCVSNEANIDVIFSPVTTPTFYQIDPLCQNSIAPTLPATSSNNIAGTWDPSVINTTSAGNFTYTFTPTSGQCASLVQMTIDILPTNTIILTSGTGTDDQNVCAGNAMIPIEYAVTGADGVTVDPPFPPGVIGNFSIGNTIFTISGIPTSSGPYTIKLTGGCGMVEASGNINVLPLPSNHMLSGGNGGLPICKNTPIALTLSNSEIGVNYQLYQYTPPNTNIPIGPSIVGTGTSISWTLPNINVGTFSYRSQATSATTPACVATDYTNEITVTIIAIPPTPINIMPLNPTSCTANNGTIKISGSYTPGYSYKISYTEGALHTLDTTANSMGQLWLINLAAGNYYDFFITDQLTTCSSGTFMGPINLATPGTPDPPTIAPNDSLTFCQGGYTVLTCSNPSNYSNLQWSNIGGYINGATETTLIVTEQGNYTLKGTINDCSNISFPTIVTVKHIPDHPMIECPTNSFCKNGEYNINVSNTTPYTSATYIWFRDGIVDLQNTGPLYTGYFPGTIKLQVEVDGCKSDLSNEIVITEIAIPDTFKITSYVDTICVNKSYTFVGTLPNGVNISWIAKNIDNDPNANFSMNNAAFISNTEGNYSIEYIWSNTPCFKTDTVHIYVSGCGCKNATTADAGKDATICAGNKVILNGSSNSGVSWTSSGNGTFGDTSMVNTIYTPSVADSTAGIVTLYLTANDPDGDDGPCISAIDSMVLTIVSNATISIAPVDPFCGNDTTMITLKAMPIGGTWSGKNIDNMGKFKPSTLGIGMTTFTYTIGQGACQKVDSMHVVINDFPKPTISGLNDYCKSETPNPTVTATPSGGTWTGALTSNTIDLSMLIAGKYYFGYEVQKDGCIGSIIDSFKVIAPPFAMVQDSMKVCNADPDMTGKSIIDLKDFIQSDSTWTWEELAPLSGAINTIGATTYDFTGIPLNTVATFVYTLKGVSPCEDFTDTLRITVADICNCPNLIFKPDTSLCSSNAIIDLDSLKKDADAGTWSINLDPLILNPGILNGSIFDARDKDAGTYTFTYTLDPPPINIDCQKSKDVTVTVIQKPIADLKFLLQVCSTGDTTKTRLDLNDFFNGAVISGKWLNNSNVGLTTGTVIDFQGVDTGSYSFTFITIGAMFPCTNDKVDVEIEVTEKCLCPTLDVIIPDTSICYGSLDTMNLNLLIKPTDIGKWTLIEDPDAVDMNLPVAGGNFELKDKKAGHYKFEFKLDQCPANCPDSLLVNMTIKPENKLLFAGDTVCNNFEYTKQLKCTLPKSTCEWSFSNPNGIEGANVGKDSIFIQTLSNTSAGSKEIFFSFIPVSPDGCKGDTQFVAIRVLPTLKLNLQDSITTCANSFITLNSDPTGGIGAPYTTSWSTSETTEAITYKATADAIITVKVTDGFGCMASDTSNIAIVPAPAFIINNMPDTICSNGPYMISTDPIFTDEIQYYSYPAGFIEDNGQIRNSQMSPGISYWFAAEVTNDSGCSMTDSIKVLINNDTIHVAIIDLDPTGIGLSDGSILINPISGVQPFEYSFNNSTWVADNDWKNLSAGIYDILIKDLLTCEKIVQITLEDPRPLVFTDVITPNGDGVNDELRFTTSNVISNSELSIYNRWGDRIYHKKDYTNDWDASGYPGGVYYYILKVEGKEVKKTLTVMK